MKSSGVVPGSLCSDRQLVPEGPAPTNETKCGEKKSFIENENRAMKRLIQDLLKENRRLLLQTDRVRRHNVHLNGELINLRAKTEHIELEVNVTQNKDKTALCAEDAEELDREEISKLLSHIHDKLKKKMKEAETKRLALAMNIEDLKCQRDQWKLKAEELGKQLSFVQKKNHELVQGHRDKEEKQANGLMPGKDARNITRSESTQRRRTALRQKSNASVQMGIIRADDIARVTNEFSNLSPVPVTQKENLKKMLKTRKILQWKHMYSLSTDESSCGSTGSRDNLVESAKQAEDKQLRHYRKRLSLKRSSHIERKPRRTSLPYLLGCNCN